MYIRVAISVAIDDSTFRKAQLPQQVKLLLVSIMRVHPRPRPRPPKIDDPETGRLQRALLWVLGERTGLDEDVARIGRLLEDLRRVQAEEERVAFDPCLMNESGTVAVKMN
jgi:hypothetical protein